MTQAAMIELHNALQLLVEIPGAFSDDVGAAAGASITEVWSAGYRRENDDDHPARPPHSEHTHRRALRRIERALETLLETGLGGEDLMETDQQNQECDVTCSPVMWLAEDEANDISAVAAAGSKQLLECTNTATQSTANESENVETLKEDLVAVLHGLCLSDDDVLKQELVESCISAASQAIVSFNFTLSGENIISILNRLLLLDADNENIQSLLLSVLNLQFQDGIRISSESIAVLASFEVLEIVTKDFSANCLVEDVQSLQRSWYTLAGYLIRFSIPNCYRYASPADLRRWLVERITEGAVHEDVQDMASLWMSNACELVLSVANFALDALDTNNKAAVYYATLTYRIVACLDAAFDNELQSTVNRLWTALVFSNIRESVDFMDNELQYSIASLSLDLCRVVRDRDERTTVAVMARSLEFSELVKKRRHLVAVMPKRTLQCVVLVLLNRHQLAEQVLTEQFLERLTIMKDDGDLMDTYFWRRVDAVRDHNQYMEAG